MLSNVQMKALTYSYVDIPSWIQGMVEARAVIAQNDLVKSEMERMMNDPTVTSIPASRDDIVMSCSQPTLKQTEEAREKISTE